MFNKRHIFFFQIWRLFGQDLAESKVIWKRLKKKKRKPQENNVFRVVESSNCWSLAFILKNILPFLEDIVNVVLLSSVIEYYCGKV